MESATTVSVVSLANAELVLLVPLVKLISTIARHLLVFMQEPVQMESRRIHANVSLDTPVRTVEQILMNVLLCRVTMAPHAQT